MNNPLLVFSGIYLFSVFISSVSQILLKKSANDAHKNPIAEYLNPRVIIAYIFFFGATLVSVIAYKHVPVSLGTVFESTGYIFVTILGVVFLKERVSKRKLIGLTIILIGVVLYSMG